MKFIALTALAATLAVPAFAGNINEPIQEAEPIALEPAPVDYGNDWGGAYLGGQLGYGDIGSDGALNLEGDGAIGGIHAGYLFDLGTYVVGGELDYDIADIDLGADAGTLDSVARLKLKAGYDAGNVLYYGLVGAAQADAEVGGADLSDTGYLVGLGADYLLSESFVLGGQLIYHDFSDFDGSGVDVDATTIQARASFKF